MIRTQIQLTPQQVRSLRALAQRQGVSVAEMIRRLVDRGLSEEADRAELYRLAAEVIGRFHEREGAQEVAAKHDSFLDTAYE